MISLVYPVEMKILVKVLKIRELEYQKLLKMKSELVFLQIGYYSVVFLKVVLAAYS